jgi:hypothetical protein
LDGKVTQERIHPHGELFPDLPAERQLQGKPLRVALVAKRI